MTITGQSTKVVHTVRELRNWHTACTKADQKESRPLIGFVPTMGALHEGHMALVRQARKECQYVVVSIFVNPLQFAPHEDFGKYPRTFENDRLVCEKEGVDLIFHPSAEEIYPDGQENATKVVPPENLDQKLYGSLRPIFFVGVASVVMRLFNIVAPNIAYFGEKDFQQLQVIKKMVLDLHMPIKIVGVPTVREKDGLASSSRNQLLTPEHRSLAPIIYKTMCEVRDQTISQKVPLKEALKKASEKLQTLPGVSLKYLVACHPETLEELSQSALPMVLLLAAKFGDVWLIDTLTVSE
jgi:pantoate--beta-alanine ligase